MKTTKSPSLVPLVPLVPAKNTSGRLQHVPQSFRQNRAFVAGQPVGSKMRPIVVLVVLVEAALPRVWDPKFDRLHAICLHISQVPKRMFRIGTSAFNSHESHADPTTKHPAQKFYIIPLNIHGLLLSNALQYRMTLSTERLSITWCLIRHSMLNAVLRFIPSHVKTQRTSQSS